MNGMKILVSIIAAVAFAVGPLNPAPAPEAKDIARPAAFCDWFPNMPGCNWWR